MKTKPLIISTILFSVLFLIILISASVEDIKPVVCGSINLTEPNCTTWWDGLGLTDANLTINITIKYITNITHVNYTTYNTTNINNTNITYTGNYTVYNVTNNITHYTNDSFNESMNLDNYYSKSEVDDRIADTLNLEDYVLTSEIDTIINQTLSNSSSEFVITTTNDVKTVWKVWLWIIGIIVLVLAGLVSYILIVGGAG